MSTRTRITLALALLPLAVALGWWLMRQQQLAESEEEEPVLETALAPEAWVLPSEEVDARLAPLIGGGDAVQKVTRAGEPVVPDGYFAGFPADAVLPMRVHGRLVDPEGAPWADVVVRLLWDSRIRGFVWDRHAGKEPDFDSTITDAEGRFDFTTPRLIRLGVRRMTSAELLPCQLLVLDPRCAATLSRGVQALEEADLGAVVVAPGGAVHGRVVDAEGRPIAGAEVSNAWGEALPEALVQTRTDEQGRFALASFDVHENAMFVEAPGFMPRLLEGLPVVAGASTQLLDIVLAREDPVAGAIAGRVLDPQGEPLPGATVRAFGPEGAGAPVREGSWLFGLRRMFEDEPRYRSLSTDTEGRFAFTGLDGEARCVLAWAPGLSPVLLRDVVPGTVDLELRLPVEPVVRLLLRDAEGAPVDADEIHVRWRAEDGQLSPDLPCRRLEPGAFGVTVGRDGGLDVWVSAPGCAVARTQLAVPPTGDLTLTLDSETVLEGQVVDERGVPVPRAWVEVKLHGARCSADRSVLTDHAGRFRATRLRGGFWQIRLLAEGRATTSVPNVELRDGERRTGEVFVLPRGGEIHGVVRHADGTAARPSAAWGVADQVVVDPVAQDDQRWVDVSPSGEFTVRALAAGRWQIRLAGLASKDVDIAAGDVAQVELVVPSWPVVRGRVLQAGRPVGGVRVFYESVAPEAGAEVSATRRGASPPSRDDGSFLVAVPEAGRFALWAAMHGGGRSAGVELDLELGDQPELELQLGTAIIRGRVTCAEDGSPVEAEVGIRGARAVTTSEDGSFVLQGLLPGTYDIVVQQAGGAPAELLGVQLGEGEVREGVELFVQRPSGASGR